jgi:toxin CptA
VAERPFLLLGPSRLLASALGGAHALAAAALWLTPLPFAWRLAGSLGLAGHLAWSLRRHAWRTAARSVVELELRDDCSILARPRAGGWVDYQLDGGSFVSPLLTVLRLRPEARRLVCSVLITPDSLDPDSFRRLRVWLRWRYRSPADKRAVAAH